ncbi:MAG: hypothetical protein ACF8AM_15935 [Rhodopirellula sp. JB055]|uniref:hypothetical protein n=1 Tax=Rhodopirellula sp. JB055 TaxID=3342846 RepID=UPI00370C7BBC
MEHSAAPLSQLSGGHAAVEFDLKSLLIKPVTRDFQPRDTGRENGAAEVFGRLAFPLL